MIYEKIIRKWLRTMSGVSNDSLSFYIHLKSLISQTTSNGVVPGTREIRLIYQYNLKHSSLIFS